jgi:hypothetical protein
MWDEGARAVAWKGLQKRREETEREVDLAFDGVDHAEVTCYGVGPH